MSEPGGWPRRTAAEFRRRFRSLAVGEAFNIVWLPFVFLVAFGVPASPANAYFQYVNDQGGLGLLVLLLAEGTAFWVTKIAQLDRGLPRPLGIRVFVWLRAGNVVLLAAGMVATVTAVASDPGAATLAGLGFAVFALGEHVNDFHVQLMPTPSWSGWRPRRSRLARDLDAARSSRRRCGR